MGARGIQARADSTRAAILQTASEFLRREGVQGLSMRAVAGASSRSLGSIQHHFREQDEFVRAVIRFWAEGITESLGEAAGQSRGLERTLKLGRRWITLLARERIPFEALRLEAKLEGHDGALGMLVEVLKGRVDETHRSLQQAKLRHELVEGVDPRAVSIDLHEHLWSLGWTSAVYGRGKSVRAALTSLWHRLRSIAAEPEATIGSLDALLGPDPVASIESEDEPGPEDPAAEYIFIPPGPGVPTWTIVLQPDDPQYQAFRRHQLLGDPHNFGYPPEVLPEDVAAAETVRRLRTAAQPA